jgi:hypothetical protein
MTDNAYSNSEVLRMEACVLEVLEFNFTFPTALSFLEVYTSAINSTDLPTELFAKFLLELSLTDLPIQRFFPSTLALASLVLAWKRLNQAEPYLSLNCSPNIIDLDQLVRQEAL